MVAVSQVKGTPFAATCYPLIRNLGVPLFLCGAIARAFATVNSGTPTHVEWHNMKNHVSTWVGVPLVFVVAILR